MNELRQTSSEVLRTQLELDIAEDWKDLRALMRDAVEKRSDVEMMHVLGVGMDKLPEAINALQRALKVKQGSQDVGRSGSPLGDDPIERRFLEMGIYALQRLSGVPNPLPMWTVAPDEISWSQAEPIGTGFSADVHRCSWKGHTVAVKRLRVAISYQVFTREVRRDSSAWIPDS